MTCYIFLLCNNDINNVCYLILNNMVYHHVMQIKVYSIEMFYSNE